MKRVRIYLRTELFALTGADGHVPSGSAILTGQVREESRGGLVVSVDLYQDGRGRTLEGAPTTLFLPIGKIDHIQLLDE